MQYRARRRHRKLGWPEVWLVSFVVLALAPAMAWWSEQYQPDWMKTAGNITSVEFQRVHYNAQDYRTKVDVTYDYIVGMGKYLGEFHGYWPEVGSPNALAPSEIEKLKEPKCEVFVFYDPGNIEHSTLHPKDGKSSPLWIVLTVAGLCIAGAYTFFVYPAWRA
ncbi:MAG: DUF3592 domain-containing protein [Candidatus Hydrogenedentes bacterium]|nr:DUF3592 domain-containing protein [Candidatus Hydrogenedentota bacterium]